MVSFLISIKFAAFIVGWTAACGVLVTGAGGCVGCCVGCGVGGVGVCCFCCGCTSNLLFLGGVDDDDEDDACIAGDMGVCGGGGIRTELRRFIFSFLVDVFELFELFIATLLLLLLLFEIGTDSDELDLFDLDEDDEWISGDFGSYFFDVVILSSIV